MIRVSKSTDEPATLSKTKRYDGEDVAKQLFADQHHKCYLCERTVDTDYQIEHLKSKKHFPALIQQWTNLLLSCNYCNAKKGDRFDGLISPLTANIEDEIKQTVDFENAKAVFETVCGKQTDAHKQTIILLNRIFNGSKNLQTSKLPFRTTREQKLYDHVVAELNSFTETIRQWLDNPDDINLTEAIRKSLSIDSELLGFKYWIVQSNIKVLSQFRDCITWNKS